jgi:ABC-type nitrate/sulfonate/bicarbonate transport system substrate-binding protein
MTRRPTTPLALLALVALLLAAAGCGSDDDADGSGSGSGSTSSDGGTEQVTVVLDWSPNTNHNGVYLAEAEGWYEEAGLSVDIIEPGDVGSTQLLASGQADVGFTVQEELVPARAQGVPVVGIAAVIEHNTSSLVSLASEGITRPRDLEGKAYGGFGGALEQALVETLVECDGGDPSKVRFTEVGDADYRVGMERDQYDAVWIFDGWDGIRYSEVDGLDIASIPFIEHDDCIPDWYTPILAASEQALEERADVLRTFMDVTARGYREAMADPQAASDALLGAVPELDPQLVEASSEYLSTRYASSPDTWGRIDPDRWSAFVDFLVEAGVVEEAGDVEAGYTDELLPGD